jgi:signal peptidase II
LLGITAVPNSRRFALYLAVAGTMLVLDQLTKMIVAARIPLNDAIPVIPGVFSISHVLNSGAAFSMFADAPPGYARIGLIAFSMIVIGIISAVLWRSSGQSSRANIALSLILGGALGNLVDRVTVGSVVDFLAFRLGSYHWPDFNVADSSIVCGSLLLVADSLLTRHEQPSATASD